MTGRAFPADESRPADLHLHSTCSDGLLAPEAMMEEAAAAGLQVVALTDHDTVAGLEAAAAAARRLGLRLVPGVEISVRHPRAGERHLLAYGVDPAHPGLQALLAANRDARRRRLTGIVDALDRLGVPVGVDECLAQAGSESVGRPHVADALVAAGHCASRQEAFDRYLGDDGPANVPKEDAPVAEAIQAVHAAGGVAALAHPGRRHDEGLVPELARLGLDGLEVIHPSHSPGAQRTLAAAARRHGLLQTGGSDCHGDAEGLETMRSCRVPAEVAQRLLDRLARGRNRHGSLG